MTENEHHDMRQEKSVVLLVNLIPVVSEEVS